MGEDIQFQTWKECFSALPNPSVVGRAAHCLLDACFWRRLQSWAIWLTECGMESRLSYGLTRKGGTRRFLNVRRPIHSASCRGWCLRDAGSSSLAECLAEHVVVLCAQQLARVSQTS